MAIAEPEASSTAKALLRARARTRFNQSMKLVRRAHLYAGLLMTPWVFLYGVTALLFNHPQLFPDGEQTTRSIAPADLAGTPLEKFPSPQALATQVVAAINESAGPEAATKYTLVQPAEAAFAREYTTLIPGGDANHQVRLDLASGAGTIRTSPARKEPERDAAPPFARRPIKLESAPMEAISKSLSMVLTRFDLPQAPTPTARPTFEPEQTGAGEGRGGERRRGRRDEARGDAERPEREDAPDRPRGNGRSPRPEAEADAGESQARPDEPRSGERPERRDAGTRRREPAAEVAAGANASEGGPRGGQGFAPGGRGGGRGGFPVGPELNFLMKAEGESRAAVWRVGYNLQTGAITGRPSDAPRNAEPLSNRRFLLRLHTAHGYPSQWNSRVVWAAVVDVMAVCMVGWGVTGLMMWWQMKNVRRIGAVLMVLSVIGAVAVAVGMHNVMTSGV